MTAKKSHRVQMRIDPELKSKVHAYCQRKYGELSQWQNFTWCLEMILNTWLKKQDQENL